MKQKFIITYFLSFCGSCMLAQSNLDSLHAVWYDQNQSDSIRSAAYYDYINVGFLYSQPDTAFVLADSLFVFGHNQKYPIAIYEGFQIKGKACLLQFDYSGALENYTQCLRVCMRMGDLSRIAKSFGGLGEVYYTQDNSVKALENYTQSLRIYKQLSDQKSVANVSLSIGAIYVRRGTNAKALEFFSESLKILEQFDDQKRIGATLVNIGLIYADLGDLPKAFEYYTQSVEIFERGDFKFQLASVLNNMGLVHRNEENCAEALEYYSQSLKVFEQIEHQAGIAIVTGNIGIVYADQGEYAKAMEYYTKGIKVFEQIGDQWQLAIMLCQLGLLYKEQQGDYEKALKYCQKSYDLSLDQGYIETQKWACECLYTTYKEMDNTSKALEYHERVVALDDSLRMEEVITKLQQMEFEKTQLADSLSHFAALQEKDSIQKNVEQEKKYLITIIASSSTLLLSFITFLIFRNRTKKRQIALKDSTIEQQQLNEKMLADKLKSLKGQLIRESKTGLSEVKAENNKVTSKHSLTQQIKEDNNWLDFLNDFNTTYNGFLDKLKIKYPVLSKNDIRVACLTKLGLTLKEQAELLVVSHASISKAKSRLRDRLGLDHASDIAAFMDDFIEQYC